MAKSGMNPKALQYLMGHSDISVTLNVYTHVKFEDAKAEIERIANVQSIYSVKYRGVKPEFLHLILHLLLTKLCHFIPIYAKLADYKNG